MYTIKPDELMRWLRLGALAVVFGSSGFLAGVGFTITHGMRVGELLVQAGLRMVSASQRQVWQSTVVANKQGADNITGTIYIVAAEGEEGEE